MSEGLRTTSESPTIKVLVLLVPLFLQILDPGLHSLDQGERFPGHSTGGLKSHLARDKASVVIVTTPNPSLEEGGHLDLVVSVGESLVVGTNCVGKAEVVPG